MKPAMTLFLALAALSASSAARADGAAPVYTTRTVYVVGQRAVPIAAVEVTRALPRLDLHELSPSFAPGIEAKVATSPF
jgi:hypothetical protein